MRFKVLLLLLVGIGIMLVWFRRQSAPTATRTENRIQSTSSAPPPSKTNPPSGEVSAPSQEFARLPVLQRSTYLKSVETLELSAIFRLWRDASRVDRDLTKQGAIATTFAYALRSKKPAPELLQEMRDFVFDQSNSIGERVGLLGICGFSKTETMVEFLLQMIPSVDGDLKKALFHELSATGELWGDGSYHEERSPPLERTWSSANDPELLLAIGIAMAQIGAPAAVETLLSAALLEDGKDDLRRQIAQNVIGKIYTRNAVPPVAAILAKESSASRGSELAANVLVGIGDENAAKAVVAWIQRVDDLGVPIARTCVLKTRTPVMLDAWKAALLEPERFRSRRVLQAIADGVANYNK